MLDYNMRSKELLISFGETKILSTIDLCHPSDSYVHVQADLGAEICQFRFYYVLPGEITVSN